MSSESNVQLGCTMVENPKKWYRRLLDFILLVSKGGGGSTYIVLLQKNVNREGFLKRLSPPSPFPMIVVAFRQYKSEFEYCRPQAKK